jgi:predicted nucleotidyltransferase
MQIRTKDKDSLVNIFKNIVTPVEIWAYGSRVNNTAHDTSDLDLVIRTQNLKPYPFDEYILLKEKITESNIPILIDLKDWNSLPNLFHNEIIKQYELIYSNLNTK